jgi:hypothetical protein
MMCTAHEIIWVGHVACMGRQGGGGSRMGDLLEDVGVDMRIC